MTGFQTILDRAEARKGGPDALARILSQAPSATPLATLSDDRVLAEMTRRVFCAGFVWKVIEAKWPGFEVAFLGFDPPSLLGQPDEFWDALTADSRIIRNGAKIMSVRANAAFVAEVSGEHGRFARFLANWPPSDQIGLAALLARRGARLGGATGPMLLRFLGWEGFMLSRDVVACLRGAGLDIAETPTSKRDLAAVQAQFNAWAAETGRSHAQLSRICALSIGPNYAPEELARMGGGESD